jgi:cytochrome c553
MEKVFFSIVRIIMLTIAVLALLSFIFGSFYTYKLYLDSKNTSIEKKPYIAKKPEVKFDTFRDIMKEKEEQRLRYFLKIKTYVLSIIANGSQGHGYPDGNMPKKLFKGKEADEIATYVANSLKGDRPTGFKACALCHGIDGKGNFNSSPSLLELPIYNNLRKMVSKTEPYNKENIDIPKKEKSQFDKYINTLASLLNVYANRVGQDGVADKELRSHILKTIRAYSPNQEKEYLLQLKKATLSLSKYGETYNEKRDLKAVEWKDFILWFTEEFNNQIEKEKLTQRESEDNINALLAEKEAKATEAKVKLILALQVLGGALVVFVLITMMLVLLKIEKNTRANIVKNEK